MVREEILHGLFCTQKSWKVREWSLFQLRIQKMSLAKQAHFLCAGYSMMFELFCQLSKH